MGGKIGARAPLAQIPDDLPRGDDKRGNEGPHPMPDVLVLAFFWLARVDRLGRIATLENLHPCFFISADDAASLLVKAQSLARELTNILCLALKGGIVAVEPVPTPRRLEVCLFQDAPDAGATEGRQPMLRACCDQVIQTPPGGGAMIGGRFPGRHCEHSHALSGGKRAVGAPSAGHPAGRGSRAPDSADANGPPYGAHRPSHRPLADWLVGLPRRSGG